jgi:8-hydroxy-5-deazaflavin:NADPH oxidoreductase
MQIGIIGSGIVGRALGAWLAKAGFSVFFASRNQAHAIEAAQIAGFGARSTTITTLVRESDVIFLTRPFSEIGNALATAREFLAGKILVDVTNPISPDRRELIIGHNQ